MWEIAMNVRTARNLFSRTIVLIGLLLISGVAPPAPPIENEIQKLLASDGAAGDSFGATVAVDGDTAVIAATGKPAFGLPRGGAVYVFTRIAGLWTEQQQLTSLEPDQQSVGTTGRRLQPIARLHDRAGLSERPALVGGAPDVRVALPVRHVAQALTERWEGESPEEQGKDGPAAESHGRLTCALDDAQRQAVLLLTPV